MPLFVPTLTCPHCGYDDVPETIAVGHHIKATCKRCGSYIKFIGQPAEDFRLFFGKYKDQKLKDIAASDEGRRYLLWYVGLESANAKAQEKIREYLKIGGK